MVIEMKAVFGVLIGVAVILGFYAIGFGITGLIIKGICWAFSLTFSWKVAFGIWLIMILVGSIFSGTKHVKKVN